MTQIFKKTDKQVDQARLLASASKHILSYGGSRSAKTFGICRAMVIRAAKTRSRHIALRLKFNHAKTSLFLDTFPKLFSLCFPGLEVRENRSDWYYSLPNGSEIWIGGLDEKERVEKILGKEYSTIFFNECSQIPYSSVTMALTRLAERSGLKTKAYYDCNPPTKRHWTYPLFIRGLDPQTWEPRDDADNYASIRMNPTDNLDNIDPDYIQMLEQLPEKDRLRFLQGEFTDESEGSIYHAFRREDHVISITRSPRHPIVVGMDFNVNPMTAVICQLYDDSLYVIDEIYLENSNTHEMTQVLKQKYGPGWTVIPDATGKALKTSAAGISDHEILKQGGYQIPFVRNPFRADRYNCVNGLLEKKRIIVDPKCPKLIRDLEQVSYKEGTNLPETKEKHLTHISDALGYVAHWAYPLYDYSSGDDVMGVKR